MTIKNLDYLRGLKSSDFPDLGAKLYEALKSIAEQSVNMQQQTNANPTGAPQSPPSVNGLKVQAANGHFSGAITDENPLYRGVQYYAEHDTDPNFTNPQIVHLGDSRNFNMFLGNGTHYFRAYSAYAGSAPGAPAYHGSAAEPLPVVGGGEVGSPAYLPSQSSGTGTPGQGLTGPGIAPFRAVAGKPPVR
jgi:hypothetical protein